MEDAFEGTQIMMEGTQTCVNDASVAAGGAMGAEEDVDAAFGLLRRLGGEAEEVRLTHRLVDGVRDRYSIGRAASNDIIVNNKMVSGEHCFVYCDYSGPRLGIYLEDCSGNGTFVNNAGTRL